MLAVDITDSKCPKVVKPEVWNDHDRDGTIIDQQWLDDKVNNLNLGKTRKSHFRTGINDIIEVRLKTIAWIYKLHDILLWRLKTA